MLEIPPAKGEKGRFTRMLRNGFGSKTDQLAKAGKGKGKAKAKAKAKERKVATATERANLCATIGARGMVTVGTGLPATSRTMVL